jgi:hypothetical protein
LLDEHLKERKLRISREAKSILANIIDIVFFASLTVEESEAVRIAVAVTVHGPQRLERERDTRSQDGTGIPTWEVTRIIPIPLTVESLAKFSRCLEYGRQLAILSGKRPRIVGIARRIIGTNGGGVPRIAAPRPGVLVFEMESEEQFRFEAGRKLPPRIDVLAQAGPVRDAISTISGASRGADDSLSSVEQALSELLPKIRALSKGAILAIFPQKPSPKVLDAIRYKRDDPMLLGKRIAEKHKLQRSYHAGTGDSTERAREEVGRATRSLNAALDDLAHLSTVDGAVVIGPELAVYGSGYLINSAKQIPKVVKANDALAKATERYEGSHGARHTAAFSFAWENKGGVAFVISEDGPVRCVMRIKQRLVVWLVHILET